MNSYHVKSGDWSATIEAENPKKAVIAAVLRDNPEELALLIRVRPASAKNGGLYFSACDIFKVEETEKCWCGSPIDHI